MLSRVNHPFTGPKPHITERRIHASLAALESMAHASQYSIERVQMGPQAPFARHEFTERRIHASLGALE